MEFGLLKSKIETKLSNAYVNKKLEPELKKFKKFVLENNEVKKLYYLYDELSKEKNFDKSFAEDYLNECVDMFQTVTPKKQSINLIENWVKDIVCENYYKDIDNVFSKKTFIVETILESKNNIINKLSSKETNVELINIDLTSVVNIANTTLKNYLSQISESDQKEIKKYLTLSEENIKNRYDILSEMAIEKLQVMLDESDNDTKTKISETIEKIKSDDINLISLLKLKNLADSL